MIASDAALDDLDGRRITVCGTLRESKAAWLVEQSNGVAVWLAEDVVLADDAANRQATVTGTLRSRVLPPLPPGHAGRKGGTTYELHAVRVELQEQR